METYTASGAKASSNKAPRAGTVGPARKEGAAWALHSGR